VAADSCIDDDSLQDNGSAQALGQIELQVMRVEVTETEAPQQNVYPQVPSVDDKIHERSKKMVSHRIG
jgi:hypothetical protein